MTKFKFSIILGAVLVMLSGCADEDLAPILTFDSAGKGAYPRLIEEGNTLINLLEDASASTYTYTVEFIDLQQGELVAEYVLEMTYEDNNPGNGDASNGPIVFRTFTQSDFTTNENGYRQVSVTIPASEAISAAGTSFDQLMAGDNFEFDGRVVLEDGSQFGAENSSSTVRGAAFRGHFDFTMPANCPSDLTGTYDVMTTDIWCGGDPVTTTVDIEALGGGSYEFSDWAFGAYGPCYGGGSASGDLNFQEVCTVVSFTGFTDSFGDTWTYDSSIDGNEWTIAWENTYGEAGTSVIMYPGGADWPITLE